MRTQKRSHPTDSALNSDLERLFAFDQHSPYVYNQTNEPVDPQEFDLWSNADSVPKVYLNGTWQELTYESTPIADSAYVRRDGTTAMTANWDAGDYIITNEQFTSEYLLVQGSDRLDSGKNEQSDSWQGSVARFWRNANAGDSTFFGTGVFTAQIADVIIDAASGDINASHFVLYTMADIRAQHSGGARSFYGIIGQARVHADSDENLLTSPSFTDSIVGVTGSFKHLGSSTISRAGGLQGIAHVAGTATLTSLYGVESLVYASGASGTVTTANAFWARQATNVGTITNYRGLQIDNMTGGTITNMFGIRINDLTAGASTNYGIYFDTGTTAKTQGICWSGNTWLYRAAANQLTFEGTTAATNSIFTVKALTGYSAVLRLHSGPITISFLSFSDSEAGRLKFLSGGTRNVSFFENATDAKNPWIRVYGYPSGQSLQYGSFQITASSPTPLFQISTSAAAMQLGVTGDDDVLSLTANMLTVNTEIIATNVILRDDGWIGLGVGGGRIVFDSTPATDLLTFTACNVSLTAGNLTTTGTITGVNVTSGTNPGHLHTIYMKDAGTPTDNTIPRFDGTDGITTQTSGVLIDDSDNITTTGLITGGTLQINGEATVEGAVRREGWYEGVAATMQTCNGTTLAIEFDSDARIDTDYFTHDTGSNPEQITVDKAGWYRINYSVHIDTDLATNRSTFRAYVYNNTQTATIDKLTSYAYVRATNYGRHASIHANAIVQLAASDVLILYIDGYKEGGNFGDGDCDGDTIANETHITIEYIDEV